MNGMIIGILAAICILLAAVSVRENRKYKALEDNVKTVSYTHLDVYKRQKAMRKAAG